MPFFADDAQNTMDASQMRRAGTPSVTTKRGALSTMARLADQEARHKNVLRPKGTASYDPKTREMRRLSAVVERLALEQRESLKAESAAADVFSAVSNRVAVVEKAFGDLADAVSEELRVSRAEREKWSAHLEAARVVVDACDARTSACVERCDALANTFDDHETARLEARAAAAAVVEARAVLAEAERRAEDTAGRLQSLQDVARGADAALQAQVDEIRDAVVSLDARVGVGVGVSGAGVSGSGATQGDHKVADASHITTRDILLAGAASEADVVALRDWTRRTAGAHAERLARVEAAVEAETKKTKKKSGKNANAKRSSSRDGDASETRGVPTPTSRRRSSEDRSSEGSA
jgi:hypothetical protein